MAFLLLALGSMLGGFVQSALSYVLLGVTVHATGGNPAVFETWAAVAGGLAGLLVTYLVFRGLVRGFITPKVIAAANVEVTQSAV